jgi:beta-galactosidase/beta-glucuronidase
MNKLASWTEVEDEAVKYYSGTATYSRNFTIDDGALKEAEVYVMFEDIQEMARVKINGNDCGIVWLPPYKVNITKWLKPGENTISVQVVNTWNNRIVGDLNYPDVTQYTSTNIKTRRFRATSPLLKSGLLGKAEIVFTDN